VRVPAVFEELSNDRVLVMEFIDGIPGKHRPIPKRTGLTSPVGCRTFSTRWLFSLACSMSTHTLATSCSERMAKSSFWILDWSASLTEEDK
jgi:hypothetical protein